MRTANRRRFLYFALGAGAAAGLGVRTMFRGQEQSPLAELDSSRDSLVEFQRSSSALGSEVSITALHHDPEIARQAVDQAFDELELVEELMSIYRPHSQLCELNRAGRLAGPHPYLLEVLRAAQALSRRTDGAFDVTVQPLWQLFAEADREGRLPTAAEITRQRSKVDWKCLKAAPDSVQLRKHGAAVTLNGIAQGFAADRVAAVLRRNGIRHALVNTGEMAAIGGKNASAAWRVGIQHPRRADAFVSLAALKDRCLATSGDYATTFGGDAQFNHIFDPRTGLSPTELASVSVAARTGLEADALSTAAFVLGPEKGFELIRATPGADALMILKNGRTLVSAGFPICEGNG